MTPQNPRSLESEIKAKLQDAFRALALRSPVRRKSD